MPRTLKPIDYQKQAPKGGKIVGNYAAQVLADLEEKDQNRERATAMKQLDRDIKGYLKFDVKGMAEQMNEAFDGSKGKEKKPAGEKQPSGKRKKETKTLAITAGSSTSNQLGKYSAVTTYPLYLVSHVQFCLDPILEEPSNPGGYEVSLYKPNQSLADQRKAKNEELKRKVKMITAAEKLETASVASSDSMVSANQGTFITRTKAGKKKRSGSSSSSSSDEMAKRPDSPTARAAMALEMLNKGKNKEMAVVPVD